MPPAAAGLQEAVPPAILGPCSGGRATAAGHETQFPIGELRCSFAARRRLRVAASVSAPFRKASCCFRLIPSVPPPRHPGAAQRNPGPTRDATLRHDVEVTRGLHTSGAPN
ncbi:hypothetical protein GCM10008965_03190 [Methylorubrum aminovorans]|nr:hypothetical protein GCM10025880_23560 [Methylorubrum aminovorans]